MREWVPILPRQSAAANGIATAWHPSARIRLPKSGGGAPVILTVVTIAVVVLQDIVGVSLADRGRTPTRGWTARSGGHGTSRGSSAGCAPAGCGEYAPRNTRVPPLRFPSQSAFPSSENAV